jgi:hypothetical protein
LGYFLSQLALGGALSRHSGREIMFPAAAHLPRD